MPSKRRAAARAPIRGRRQPEFKEREPADQYDDMLSEASAAVPTSSGDEGRPIKKRKTAVNGAAGSQSLKTPPRPARGTTNTPQSMQCPTQVVYDDYRTEDSDIEFEDVGLDAAQSEQEAHEPELTAADRATDLNIAVVINGPDKKTGKRGSSQRLPPTTIEKQKRIDVHKLHVCCLLAHVYVRNAWCNDERIQHSLLPILDKRVRSYLNPQSTLSQFQRSRSLHDGLQQAADAFHIAFRPTAKGLRLPQWKVNTAEIDTTTPPKNTDLPLKLKDFTQLARKRQGSRDVGAQLFCALLRGVGVDARLICSLQPLSFAAAPSAPSPQKQKPTVRMTGSDTETGHSGNESAASATSSVVGTGVTPKIPPPIKRFGGDFSAPAGATDSVDLGAAPSPVKPKTFKESKYPVYWVEVFDEAYQKWLAVDPLVTRTVDKPQKFEPPASDSANDTVYVIAFSEDGSARDVTRRYTKAYNAKTRRARVESTKDGPRWWKRALRVYKGLKQDRDQVEDAELAKKEAAEPMPRNVQDFKDHPYYALERYLKHNEVIQPKREVGKLSTGKGTNAAEPIYRRRDVQIVKSADKWYRMGRELKANEQPLKYGTARRSNRRNCSPTPEEERAGSAEGDEQGLALYAEHQTSLYIPKPVVDGRIPKNAFGNLDLYVSSMIPPGSVHIRTMETAKAAKLLGVDYADAITGFKFQGRRGTAIVDGAVVAKEYQEAIQEVIHGLRWQVEQEEAQKREKEAVKMWKRFLVGLRVRERIMGYEVEGEDKDEKANQQVKEEMDADDGDNTGIEQGGFMPDADQGPLAQPTAGRPDDDPSLSATTFDINDFADAKIKDAVSALDTKITVVRSPWDEGGPLHHLTPHKVVPMVGTEVNARHRPQLPRTHTPGLFLSPTKDDQDIGGGGGFFAENEVDNNEKPIGLMSNNHDHQQNVEEDEHDALFDGDDDTNRERALSEEGGGFVIDESATEQTAVDTKRSSVPNEAAGAEQDGAMQESKEVDEIEEAATTPTSLLSHNEEDEDAEPDWLVDEIGW